MQALLQPYPHPRAPSPCTAFLLKWEGGSAASDNSEWGGVGRGPRGGRGVPLGRAFFLGRTSKSEPQTLVLLYWTCD